MIRGLLRIAAVGILGTALAVAVDRWLGARSRPEDGEPALSPIRTSIEIGVPIERVWIRLAEVERQPEWMNDLRWARVTTPGPIRVGTRADGLVRILGIGVRDPIEVIEFLPPQDYAVRHEGPFRGTGVFRLEALDGDRTQVTWDETLIPPVLPNLISLIQAPLLGRVFRADLERLREQLEIEAITTPA